MSNVSNDLYDNYFSLTADVILSITVIATVLTILFFTIGKIVEKRILEKQIQNIVRDLNESFIYQYGKDSFYDKLKEALENYKPDKSADEKINDNNTVIFNNTIKIVTSMNIIACVILLILYLLSKKMKKDMNIGYYIFKNIILTICVTLTELFFLLYISNQYMYVDSNFLYKHILKHNI